MSKYVKDLVADDIRRRIEGVDDAVTQFSTEIQHRYEEGRHDITRPLLPPQDLFIQPADLFEKISPTSSSVSGESESKSVSAVFCSSLVSVKSALSNSSSIS